MIILFDIVYYCLVLLFGIVKMVFYKVVVKMLFFPRFPSIGKKNNWVPLQVKTWIRLCWGTTGKAFKNTLSCLMVSSEGHIS